LPGSAYGLIEFRRVIGSIAGELPPRAAIESGKAFLSENLTNALIEGHETLPCARA
jgi:hypothetical protein